MLHLYTPEPVGDTLLAQWWADLQASGDLELIFHTPPTLSQFLHLFQEPTCLLLGVEEGPVPRIWFAAWFDPVFNGAFFSVWIAEKKRRSKSALQAMIEAARLGLQQFPCLIGVTKQPHLVEEHIRFGYRLLGELPAFFSGKTAWILVLDKRGFARWDKAQADRRTREPEQLSLPL